MTRVVAPSRLHFGLFHVPSGGAEAASPRRFGGVGVMIEQPGTVVTVRLAESWQIEGMLASRAQLFAQRFIASLSLKSSVAFQILVERCPPDHVGLGVGTQLGLTVAKALAVELGYPSLTAVELAERIGRGERSAVGVHGFDRGGLIIEAGKLASDAISPLLHAESLPREWRVVMAIPPVATRWHGDRERTAFEQARPAEDTSRGERLRRLALEEILPAAREANLARFGESLYEFNRLAGEPFAAVQGGVYAGEEVASLVALLRDEGIVGVGQSSWGPSVFGFVRNDTEARRIVAQIRRQRPEVQAFASAMAASGASYQSVAPAGH